MLKKFTFVVLVGISLLHATEINSIADIRKVYTQIHNTLSSMYLKRIDVSYQSSEGGEIKVYSNPKAHLRMIKKELFGEMGKYIHESYYADDKLFFVFEADIRYNAPMYSNMFDSKQNEVIEDRYYFIHGKMIRWLHGKKQIDPKSQDFEKKAQEILQTAQNIKQETNLNKARI